MVSLLTKQFNFISFDIHTESELLYYLLNIAVPFYRQEYQTLSVGPKPATSLEEGLPVEARAVKDCVLAKTLSPYSTFHHPSPALLINCQF